VPACRAWPTCAGRLRTGISLMIDPDSAVPPYEQVAEMLRDEIAQPLLQAISARFADLR
jgi:hypothetical protein